MDSSGCNQSVWIHGLIWTLLFAYGLHWASFLEHQWNQNYVSFSVRKRTYWHMRPTKTEIFHPVWSVFVFSMKKLRIIGCLKVPSENGSTLIRLHECTGWSESSLGTRQKECFLTLQLMWYLYMQQHAIFYETRCVSVLVARIYTSFFWSIRFFFLLFWGFLGGFFTPL